MFGVADASTEADFGSHTRFEQGLVAVTGTVIASTVTLTASDLRSDAVERL